ncbi:hypothetical protein D3C81_1983720 [compost metagenome]
MTDDLEFRQQGVTVVACRIHRVAPIGELRPEAVGEEFVLGHAGPVAVAPGMVLMGAVHFLQEHHVGADTAHRFTQFGQDEAPIEGGEALVGIDREHGKTAYRGAACTRCIGLLGLLAAGVKRRHV